MDSSHPFRSDPYGQTVPPRRKMQPYTLRDIYNAARTEKHFNYTFWLHILLDIILLDWGRRIMGKFLVTMALLIITSISLIGFSVVIPHISSPRSLAYWWHYSFGLFMLFCILFNYYMGTTTSPGTPADFANVLTAEDMGDKYCKKCDAVKPKRAHHCSACGICVMKMDHHCPWYVLL